MESVEEYFESRLHCWGCITYRSATYVQEVHQSRRMESVLRTSIISRDDEFQEEAQRNTK